MPTVRTFFISALLLFALAAPAAADEATLEGYGGDGALLVGVDDGESPFAGRPGEPAGRDDGNLVAERTPSATAPATDGQAPAGTPSAPQPDLPASEQPPAGEERGGEGPARERDRSEMRLEARPLPNGGSRPADPLPPDEGAEAVSSSSAGLPFTDTELALLLAGMLGLAVLGAGMRKIALSQPHF